MLSASATLMQSLYIHEAYHTSALTGVAWVMELLSGHPECIRTELGVHLHVFSAPISDL
jgi:hypothetical protein